MSWRAFQKETSHDSSIWVKLLWLPLSLHLHWLTFGSVVNERLNELERKESEKNVSVGRRGNELKEKRAWKKLSRTHPNLKRIFINYAIKSL